MATWIQLTNGAFINLDLMEAVLPDPREPGAWRFFHPRSQRGGRPYGRPPDRPTYYDDDAGCWKGRPTDEIGMVAQLRSMQPVLYDESSPFEEASEEQ